MFLNEAQLTCYISIMQSILMWLDPMLQSYYWNETKESTRIKDLFLFFLVNSAYCSILKTLAD